MSRARHSKEIRYQIKYDEIYSNNNYFYNRFEHVYMLNVSQNQGQENDTVNINERIIET